MVFLIGILSMFEPQKKPNQTISSEVEKQVIQEKKYEYAYWSGEYQPQQEYFIATDKDTEAMRKFAEKKSEWKKVDYYAVFVTDKKFAKFPKNPISSMDFPTEQAKNIVAIFFRSTNGKIEFTTYTEPNDWENLAITDTIK